MPAVSKKIDSKGRLALGVEFANSTVLIEKIAHGEFIIKAAEVIPASEAWLFKNPEALEQLKRGIEQAKTGKLVKKSLNDKDMSWVKRLKD